jgi:PST family polysaccharide transporter
MRAKRLRRWIAHPISQNVFALYWLQFATFLVPLITLPYVARVLQPSAFGLVVFSQGFAFVLMVFIDWGFTFHGVREAAATREDPEQLAAAVHRVRGAQLLLAAASAPIAAAALVVVPKLDQHPEFLLLAWVAAVAGGLSPTWYFVGIERLRLVSLIQLGFRFVGAGLTFIFVKGPDDAWIVMALFAASNVVSWLASDILMYRQVKFRVPRLRPSLGAVRGSTVLFISTVAVTLYTSFNVVLLGLFENSAAVAHFGAAERILRVSLQVLAPIGTAVYPRIAALQSARRHERARELLAVAIIAVGAVGLVLAAALAGLAPVVIRILFGKAYVAESVPLLRVLVVIIPIAIVSAVAGSWLVTLRMDRWVARIALGAGAINVALGCILTPLFGPVGMAWSVVTAEASAALGTLIAVVRNDRQTITDLLARTRLGRAQLAPGSQESE